MNKHRYFISFFYQTKGAKPTKSYGNVTLDFSNPIAQEEIQEIITECKSIVKEHTGKESQVAIINITELAIKP